MWLPLDLYPLHPTPTPYPLPPLPFKFHILGRLCSQQRRRVVLIEGSRKIQKKKKSFIYFFLFFLGFLIYFYIWDIEAEIWIKVKLAMGFTNWVRHGQTIIKQKFNELETKWATDWTVCGGYSGAKNQGGGGGRSRARALIKMYNLWLRERVGGGVSVSECVFEYMWVQVTKCVSVYE